METKFKLGQKVWSIQLGDCEVVKINKGDEYPIVCKNKDGQQDEYRDDGYFHYEDHAPALFSSNPFFEERVMETSVSKWNQAREISATQIVELTLKDISEMYKKANGVGVPVELIRIKD